MILIAIDEHSTGTNIVKHAITYAEKLKLGISIVIVSNYTVGYIDAGISPQEEDRELQLKMIEKIKKIVNDFPEKNIQYFVPIGDPEKEIKKLIDTLSIELLVLEHHKHSLWHEVLLKSHEKDILQHIEIPILVIPENYKIVA